MKLNILFLPFIAAFLSNSCAPNIEYRDISEFTINNEVIETKQKVSLMYASATPPDEEILSYFVHAVGVVEVTGDTINILTPFNRGAGAGDSKNEFKFYPIYSEEGISYFEETINKDREVKKNIEEINTITRVSYDKRFDYVAKNNFPTVIGFIDK